MLWIQFLYSIVTQIESIKVKKWGWKNNKYNSIYYKKISKWSCLCHDIEIHKDKWWHKVHVDNPKHGKLDLMSMLTKMLFQAFLVSMGWQQQNLINFTRICQQSYSIIIQNWKKKKKGVHNIHTHTHTHKALVRV